MTPIQKRDYELLKELLEIIREELEIYYASDNYPFRDRAIKHLEEALELLDDY